MKKVVSMLMALLFLMGICVSAVADEEVVLPTFSGIVTNVGAEGVSIINAYGTTVIFQMEDASAALPEVGALIDVSYSGDIAASAAIHEFTVVTAPSIKTVSGTVQSADTDKVVVKPTSGSDVTVNLIASTTVSGKATTYKVGDTVTVTYAECAQFMTTVALATNIDVTAVKQEKEEDDLTNKKLTGVVTELSESRFTIRTSKGKYWTFKIRTKTSFPSKKEFEEGCTVTVTYDGYASSKPYAKKVNVTKTAEETRRGKIYKKSGTVEYFEGMMIGLTNGFEADTAYAKHSGSGEREPGRKVTVYYYKDNGMYYATKIKWK